MELTEVVRKYEESKERILPILHKKGVVIPIFRLE